MTTGIQPKGLLQSVRRGAAGNIDITTKTTLKALLLQFTRQ
jgi:hypothetical protein